MSQEFGQLGSSWKNGEYKRAKAICGSFSHVPLVFIALVVLFATRQLTDCDQVSVRLSPRPSRSLHFGDGTRKPRRYSWSEYDWPRRHLGDVMLSFKHQVISEHYLCPADSLLAAKTPVSTAKVSTTESSDKEVERTTSKPSEWPRYYSFSTCNQVSNMNTCGSVKWETDENWNEFRYINAYGQ